MSSPDSTDHPPTTDAPAAPAPTPGGRPLPPASLLAVAQEAEQHVATGGWGQPVRAFALVATSDLLTAEPSLATALAEAGELTAVEQELPAGTALEDYLGRLAWPPGVRGCALALERLRADPSAPEDTEAVRLLVAATRDGERVTLVRLAAHDQDDAVAVAHDVATGLEDALAASLRDD